MMKWLAFLAIALAGCGAPPPSASITSPSAAASAAVSPQASETSSCRLPVRYVTAAQGAGPYESGFLTIPGLAFSPAAEEDSGGHFYARATGRWVPVGPPALSPDGGRYAYIEGDINHSQAFVVDVRTGTQSVLASGGPWQGVGLTGDAYYAMSVEYRVSVAYGSLPIGKGLWRFPLDGGASAQLTADSRFWTWVDEYAAYADLTTGDVAGGPNSILRFDLTTRQLTTWFDHHKRSRLLAVDATGAGFVRAEAGNEELWRVPLSGEPVNVWSGESSDFRPERPVAVAGTDVWFSSAMGAMGSAIYRYTLRDGLEKVAAFGDRPVAVSGTCV